LEVEIGLPLPPNLCVVVQLAIALWRDAWIETLVDLRSDSSDAES
jgi:hypothetical protein